MGLFSKIKKAVKGVFEGVTKGLDKITGGNFSKIMGNKWVKGALLAASIVTGGIAIANGVMAAGEVGIGAAVKAFATNMTAETGTALMGKVVEGAGAFVKGVASGLANPMGSDAGQALTGAFDSGLSGVAGEAVTSADLAAAGGETASAVNASAGGVDVTGLGALDPAAASSQIPMTPNVDLTGGLDMAGAGGELANGVQMAGAGGNPGMVDMAQYGGTPNVDIMGCLDPLAQTIANAPATNPSFLERVGSAASSPRGMLTMAQMANGWAQGQMMEERWAQLEKAEENRRKSWTNGNFKMPRFTGVS